MKISGAIAGLRTLTQRSGSWLGVEALMPIHIVAKGLDGATLPSIPALCLGQGFADVPL